MSSENSDNLLTSGFEKVHSSHDISEIHPDDSSVKVEISVSEAVEPFKGDTSKECSLSVQSLSHLSLSAENFEDPFSKCDIRQVTSTFHPFKSVSTPHRQLKRKISSADSSSKKLKSDNAVPLDIVPDSRLFEERSFETLDPDVISQSNNPIEVPQTEPTEELAIGVPLISSTDSARSSNSFSTKPEIKDEYLFKSPDSQVVSSESENSHLREEIEVLKRKCDSLQQKLRSVTACKDCRKKLVQKVKSGLEDNSSITKIQSEYSAIITFSYNVKTSEPVSLCIEQLNSGSSSHLHSSGSLLSGELADISSESVTSGVCPAVSCNTGLMPANTSSTSSSIASSASSFARRKAALIRVSNGSTCSFTKPASCVCSCYCSQFFDPKLLSYNISSPKLASSSSSELIKVECSYKPANLRHKRKKKSQENIKIEEIEVSGNTSSDVTSSVTSIKSKKRHSSKREANVDVKPRKTYVTALHPDQSALKNVLEGKRTRKKTTHFTPDLSKPQLKPLILGFPSEKKKRGRKSLKEKQAMILEHSFDESVSNLDENSQKSTVKKKKNPGSVKKDSVKKRIEKNSSKGSKTVKTSAPTSASKINKKTSEKKSSKASGPLPSTSKDKKAKVVEVLFRSDVVSAESDSDISDAESECNFNDIVGGELDEEVFPFSDSKRKSTGDRILKSSTKSNIKVSEDLNLVNVLGPIPTCPLFEGYHFVITHAGPRSYYKETQISNSELSLSESDKPESDVETQGAPFDIIRLRTQIIAGKGSVYKYLTHIHKEDLDKAIVISDCPCQTPNYLLSAALNIPVYSHEVIITACMKNAPVKQFLKMEFRLAVGRTSDGNWRNFDSCRKPKSLKDFLVVLASTDNNSRLKLWTCLLKTLGAKVSLSTPTKSNLGCVGSAGLIIVDDFCPRELKDISLKESISLVSTRWLIDTIIRGKKEADTQSKYYQVNLLDV